MYQDKTPSPSSSADNDPKSKLKLKIQQMMQSRRGGNTMSPAASVSTSASSKATPPAHATSVVESEADIGKLEDVAHADDDDDDDGCTTQAGSEAHSACSQRPKSRPAVSPLMQMQGLVPATYHAPPLPPTSKSTSALGQMKGLLAILSVIFYC